MRKSDTGTKREPREIWLKRYHHWKASALSKAGFCKQEGINATCFYYWCGIFRKETATKQAITPVDPVRFLPLKIADPQVHLTIECNDVKLSCSSGLSGEQLTQWVKALRRATCSD